MKVLALVTYTMEECSNKWGSLACLGHEVVVHQYDQYPAGQHGPLVDFARQAAPDFILYIGAPGPYHGRPVPDPATLRALNAVAPMVHMCDDAADHPWWPILEEYDREKCFTVQVAIDGGKSPIDEFRNGLTLLTPIDPSVFLPFPWEQRRPNAVMCGGMGHGERGAVMNHLIHRGLLDWHPGPGRPYKEFASTMAMHRIALNHPMTGTGERMHVKGRVIEAGWAGCVLLERLGSPTENWFLPGVHYLAYDSIEAAEQIIRDTSDAVLRGMAVRFHRAMHLDHHPRIFWERVLTKMKEVR